MFGDKLKERRLKLNMTQNQVSLMTGIKKLTVCNYENNITFPKQETIYKLMEVLECDANYLFECEETSDTKLSFDEKNIIKKYRALDKHGRDMIETVLEIEYERFDETGLNTDGV